MDITDATHYPLTVIVIPDEEITIGLGYQPRAFDEPTVRDWGRWLRNLLREIVDDPARPAIRLPALDADERERMLRTGTRIVPAKAAATGWTNSPPGYAASPTPRHWSAATAASTTPDWTAPPTGSPTR